mgnify:CR=1 FL=1
MQRGTMCLVTVKKNDTMADIRVQLDEDADDDFLPTDNSVCIFASEGEHVLSLSSLLASNYHPQLERLSKFHLRFCLLVLPLTMLIFHVIFF